MELMWQDGSLPGTGPLLRWRQSSTTASPDRSASIQKQVKTWFSHALGNWLQIVTQYSFSGVSNGRFTQFELDLFYKCIFKTLA